MLLGIELGLLAFESDALPTASRNPSHDEGDSSGIYTAMART